MTDRLDPLIEKLARLGVRPVRPFVRRALVETALTHRTAARGPDEQHNQRLEHLGDAVLGYLVADLLYDLHPTAEEGVLSRIRAALVDETSLARIAESLELGALLRVGPGEEQSGLRDRPSVLADAFEALVAAIARSEGLDVAARLVSALFEEQGRALGTGAEPARIFDPKTTLQHRTQALCKQNPTYRPLAKHGPEHDPTFAVEVLLGTEVIGRGEGRTKKQAEQSAAEAALVTLAARESGAGRLAGPGGGE